MTLEDIMKFIDKHKSDKVFRGWDSTNVEHRAGIVKSFVSGYGFYATDSGGNITGVGIARTEDNQKFFIEQFIARNANARRSIIKQFFLRWPTAVIEGYERYGKLRTVSNSFKLSQLFYQQN